MIPFDPPPRLHLGPLTLTSHGLFFLLGGAAAYLWTRRRLPAELRPHLDGAATWMVLAAIVGARLLFVLQNPHLLGDPSAALAVWEGGLVSYGGMLGALLAWVAYLRVHRLPVRLMSEALGPPALLGWGVGRIGCLLNWSDEIGTVTGVPWAFVVAGDAPRHPVMLYLAVAHMAAAGLVALAARRLGLRADGLALMAYGLVRAVLDTWRDYDPEALRAASQSTALAIFMLGALIVVHARLRAARLPAPAT